MQLYHVKTVFPALFDFLVQDLFKGFLILDVLQLNGNIIVKIRHGSIGNGNLVVGHHNPAVAQSLVDRAVQHDHLPVQPLKGADARIAQGAHILHLNRAAKIPLRQRLQKRHLIQALALFQGRSGIAHTARQKAGDHGQSKFLFEVRVHNHHSLSFSKPLLATAAFFLCVYMRQILLVRLLSYGFRAAPECGFQIQQQENHGKHHAGRIAHAYGEL